MKKITLDTVGRWVMHVSLLASMAWLFFSIYLVFYWGEMEARLTQIIVITKAQYVASEVVVTVKANDSIFGESRRCKLTYRTANDHTLTLFPDELECKNLPPVITIP